MGVEIVDDPLRALCQPSAFLPRKRGPAEFFKKETIDTGGAEVGTCRLEIDSLFKGPG